MEDSDPSDASTGQLSYPKNPLLEHQIQKYQLWALSQTIGLSSLPLAFLSILRGLAQTF
jgi:hypothetical protein